MVGPIGLGDGSCVAELVGLLLHEADGESLDRLVDESAHCRRDGRRIDPPRQKHAEGHVRHQPHAHGFGEALAELGDEVRLGSVPIVRPGKGHVPVRSRLERAISPPQRMPR